MTVHKLLVVNYDGLTDALMLTAAIRDLQLCTYGSYQVDVHTLGMPMWQYNPYLTRLDWRAVPYDGESEVAANEFAIPERKVKIICYDPEIQVVYCSRRSHTASSERFKDINAYHRIHALAHDLSEKIGLSSVIPVGEMKGIVTISDIERSWVSQIEQEKNFKNFWIIATGGPVERSIEWWEPDRYQRIVDEFRGKVTFVQCGQAHEHHPKLDGVIDLIGKTDLRQMIRLMYHAAGYVGAPGFLTHLAASTPVRPFERNGRPRPPARAAVIVGGAIEPYQWFAYEGQQVLHNNGMLPCCEMGGCGKSRCESRRHIEPHPEQLCTMPVQIGRETVIPKCLDMITTKMVIDRMKFYFDGGSYFYDDEPPVLPVGTEQQSDNKSLNDKLSTVVS